jgi:hypothetical protein
MLVYQLLNVWIPNFVLERFGDPQVWLWSRASWSLYMHVIKEWLSAYCVQTSMCVHMYVRTVVWRHACALYMHACTVCRFAPVLYTLCICLRRFILIPSLGRSWGRTSLFLPGSIYRQALASETLLYFQLHNCMLLYVLVYFLRERTGHTLACLKRQDRYSRYQQIIIK